MTRAGAEGQTAAEMDEVLHAPDDLHEAMNALDTALAERAGPRTNRSDGEGEVALSVANSLWPQVGFDFEEPFLDLLAAQYGAGLHPVDYDADTEGARREINGDRTNELIPELLVEGILSKDTVLVLVNALYLKAPWAAPFSEGATENAPFTLLDGSTVDAPLMTVSDDFRYGTGDGWQAVKLPYAGEELAMTVIVPDEGAFADVEAGFDEARLAEVLDSLEPRQVNLDLPRFDLDVSFSLAETLAALGMPTAFDENRADFSAMTTEAPLFISAVEHQATITVDEEGTEASAATAVVMDEVSAPAPSDLPVDLTVDRPFLFTVTDIETGAVLFLGRVLDPTI
jgi:serpin B